MFKYLHVFAVLILVSACATQPKNRAASEYLLTTDKSTSVLFKDLKNQLGEHKYTVEREDDTAGILLLSPREFSYGGSKRPARQSIQMRQEGGSVKVRIAYECKYSADFEPCLDSDRPISAKISRIEASLIEMLQPIMVRHIEEATSEPMPASVDSPTPAPSPANADETKK